MNKKTNAIYLLSAIGFFGIFSTTMAKNPVLPLFVKALGSGDEVIGIISSVSPLAGIIFSFPVGLMSDRIGRKKLLLASAFIFLTAPLLYLFVNSAWLLIPIRFFHGLATAILGPVSSALICDEYPDSKGEKLGYYSSITLIGRTIAPIIGGAIISAFYFLHDGWNYRLVYAICFLAGIPVFLLAISFKEGAKLTENKKLRISDFFSALADFFRNTKLFGTGLAEMSTYFSFGAFESYLPVYLNSIGCPAYVTGLIFSAQVLVIALSKPFFGRLSDNIDRRIQILIGIALTGLPIALITLHPGYIYVAGISLVFGLGMSLSTVATSTYVADVAKKENIGSALGAVSSIMDIGHSSGPLITGFIVGSTGYAAGFMTAGTVVMVSGVVFALMAFKR